MDNVCSYIKFSGIWTFIERSGTKKNVSKLGLKSYLAKKSLNLPKLGNFFDGVSVKNTDQS